jgi:hypothetical protein
MRLTPWVMCWMLAVAVTCFLAVSDYVSAGCKTNICSSINCWFDTDYHWDALQSCQNCVSNVKNCWDTGIPANLCNQIQSAYKEYSSSAQFRCPVPAGGLSAESQSCSTTGARRLWPKLVFV